MSKNSELLKNILSLPSPSSNENEVRDFYLKYFEGRASNTGKDVMGNASASLVGKANSSRILLTAHMDEVGFIITRIDDEGYLRFSCLGSIDTGLVQGTIVDIYTKKGKVTGFFGRRPIHCIDDDSKNDSIVDMYIDIGAASKKTAESLVQIGDYAVWKPYFERLNSRTFAARGVDDKIGVYIISRVLDSLIVKNNKELLNCMVFGVLTPSEELSEFGPASCAASKIQPGAAVIIETDDTGDYPDSMDTSTTTYGGPIITVGPFVNRKFTDFIIDSAKELKLDYQLSVSAGATSTTLDEIRRAGAGVPCALISIPVKYLHAPFSLFDMKTVENSIKLITYICENFSKLDTFIP